MGLPIMSRVMSPTHQPAREVLCYGYWLVGMSVSVRCVPMRHVCVRVHVRYVCMIGVVSVRVRVAVRMGHVIMP